MDNIIPEISRPLSQVRRVQLVYTLYWHRLLVQYAWRPASVKAYPDTVNPAPNVSLTFINNPLATNDSALLLLVCIMYNLLLFTADLISASNAFSSRLISLVFMDSFSVELYRVGEV